MTIKDLEVHIKTSVGWSESSDSALNFLTIKWEPDSLILAMYFPYGNNMVCLFVLFCLFLSEGKKVPKLFVLKGVKFKHSCPLNCITSANQVYRPCGNG